MSGHAARPSAPIDPARLSSIAADYASPMTTIRGKRVQRLVKREFAGAERVLRLQFGAVPAIVGWSASGAAYCATDGRGRHASIVKWSHGSSEAFEYRFDLLKDSLPLLEVRSVPPDGPHRAAFAAAVAATPDLRDRADAAVPVRSRVAPSQRTWT